MIIDEQTWKLSCGGGLANIAPTVLQLMGLQVPDEMASSLLLEAVPQKKSSQENTQQDKRFNEEALKGAA